MASQGDTIAARQLIGVEQHRQFYLMTKRCLDVAISLVLLILLSPLLVLTAICIRLDSPGPIIFEQTRVGQNRRRISRRGNASSASVGKPDRRGGDRRQRHYYGRPFTFYKFRSMGHHADPSLHQAHVKAFVEGQVTNPGATGAQFKLANDPRITRLGRVLRKTSLDELPQLVNVLKGDLSLIGPRPVPVYEVTEYQAWQRARLATLPGITGLWQVKGRCDLSFEEMIRLDLEYVRSQSLWLDLKIALLTIPAVISGRGAK